MTKTTPIWAEKRLQQIMSSDEKIILEVKGRVEVKPPTGIGALFFWMKYILVNILGIFYGLFIRKTAWMVLTDKRLIILTNEGVGFPFWIIPFSKNNTDYIMFKSKLASINAIDNRIFWFISSKGFLIESTGSLSLIFNGLKKNDFELTKFAMIEGLKI